MEKFEKEYRQMIQEDMPDLWGRIEAGLKEKESSMELTGEATKAAGKSADTGTGEKEKTGGRPGTGIWEMPEKCKGVFISGWKRYAVTAAAGLCVLLMIQAVLFSISSKSSDTGENSSSARVETDGMYASGMEGAAFNTVEPETVEPETVESETAESETAASETGASADSGAEENKAWESTEQETESAAGISVERETGEMEAESAAGESTANEGEGEMKSLHLEDGTVIGQVQVIVLEADGMQYHTVYRVEVEKDDSGLLAEGLKLRILSDNDTELAEGEEYQITVLYSEEASVPFRLADWKEVAQSE